VDNLLDAVRMFITNEKLVRENDTEENRKARDMSFEALLQITTKEVLNPTLEEAPNQEFLHLEAVRDLLGKGDIPLAIKYIEATVNNDEALGRIMTQLPYVGAFEQAFKTAMRKHNVVAGFVITEPIRQPDNKYTYRMITGGHPVADAAISYHLKPLADKLGVNIGPQKDFLEITELVRRAAIRQ
jgi:hypothetical protein